METSWNINEMLGSGSFPETIIAPIDGAEMVLVAAGDFIKGISEEELARIYLLDDNENPVFATEVPSRNVYLKDFYIDRYPVTNFQYQRFVEATGHREPILLNHPLWGQPMKPVVFVGQKGCSETLLKAVDNALTTHELIKVKFNEFKEKDQKTEILEKIEKETTCETIGLIGHTAMLYRAHPDPEKRKITLPERKIKDSV